MGSVAMTALIGRVPIDGTVNDPYPFKILVGPDNLTANGIDIPDVAGAVFRSEEHTSELQSLMRISYAVFCLKKKNKLCILHTLHTESFTPNYANHRQSS